MNGYFSVVGLIICLQIRLFAQLPDPTNIGFEEGTLSGWTYTKGEVDAVTNPRQLAFIDDTLGQMSTACQLTRAADGNDPLITQEAIPMVAPGSRYSVRLGDDEVGAQFDRIQTRLLVNEATALFQYKFAVVFQDPEHLPIQQPALRIRVLDTQGQPIPCGSYEVSAARTIAGFKSQGQLRYRNWTTGLIDLRAYTGQRVTIDVTVNDCTRGGHFGYVYFDAACFPAKISQQATRCADQDTTLTLSAPAGFDQYRWSTGDTTSRLQIRPRSGDHYSVEIYSYSSLAENCRLQLDYDVTYPLPPTEQQVTICAGAYHQVGDSTYRKPGSYMTTIKRPGLACDSVVVTHLSVLELPDTPLADRAMAAGERVLLSPAESSRSDLIYQWVPTTGLACPTCLSTWATPSATTQYTLITQSANPPCQTYRPVTVTVTPCRFALPNAFSPNNDGLNDQFLITGNLCWKQLLSMTLLNRWGNVLFHQQDVPLSQLPLGWDGTYRGTPVDVGVYTYQLRVELVTGDVVDYAGAVTLLR